ncbi:hypothetical protein V490_05035 [Pseudogymnoascus sp. VKM F-3557]|nr:hypothetical protein V490_05035 [Pseudogymnoascus sp. VKM F-3557]
MRATTQPDFSDEAEYEDVPKAFIEGTSDGPIPSTDSDSKEIHLAATDGFASESPAHVIIAGIDSSKAETIDTPAINFPNTENVPIKPESSIAQPLSTTVIRPLCGSQVPTIDIILNTTGIMSIQQLTHTRARIDMYFTTKHTGYFLFSCLITPHLFEPVYDAPKRRRREKKDKSAESKRTTIVWADLYYGIIDESYETPMSALRRTKEYQAVMEQGPDGRYRPKIRRQLSQAQPVRKKWYRSLADFILLFTKIIISMLELAIVVSLPVLVVTGGSRCISLAQDFYEDINREAL